MSSNDGTRSTDACESLLAHHFLPVSLKLVDVPQRKFLGGMLLVNQANDHGEITGSGVADSAAYDSKDRIEVIIDRKSGVDIDVERLNSYRGQLGAYRRRAGASHGAGADDDGGDDSRVSQPRGVSSCSGLIGVVTLPSASPKRSACALEASAALASSLSAMRLQSSGAANTASACPSTR
jgi:hypothetical protein